VTNQGRGVTKGIQPRFVYQFASPNYYELMEHWRWMKTPMLMCLRKLRKITHRSACKCVG